MHICTSFKSFFKQNTLKRIKSGKLLESTPSRVRVGSIASRSSEESTQLEFTDVVLKFFAKFFHAFEAKVTKFELKWKEFICITFSLQLPLGYWFRHIRIMRHWGASYVLILYIICALTMAMPLYMVYMFLGNYSRKSYIKFWSCVPILKGLSYTIAFHAIFQQIFDLSISGMALLYIKNLFVHNIPWHSCNFTNVHPDCIRVDETDKEPYTKECCLEFTENCTLKRQMMDSAKYSALDYYMSYMLKLGYDQKPRHVGLNWAWVASVEFLWILIFILMVLGLSRFRGITTVLNMIIFLVLVPVSLVTVIVSTSSATVHDLYSDFSNVLKYKFWVETTIFSLHREIPGDVITFSAISSPGISTTVDTVTIYAMKTSFITVLALLISICAISIQEYYNIRYGSCIVVEGDHLIFAMIPDILSRWKIAQFWLITYFIIIFYWGFSVSVYVFNSFLEAVLEEFPILTKWRFPLSAVFCITVGSLNAFILKPAFIIFIRDLVDTTMIQMKAVIFVCSLLGLFIYSVGRIKDDYHFTYGIALNNYWTQGVKIAILLVGSASVISFLGKWDADKYKIISVLSFLPVPIGVVIAIVQYCKKTRKTLLDPDPHWGPPSYKKRLARSHFDPTYELRSKSLPDDCKHICLRDSHYAKKEAKHWKSKREIYGKMYEKLYNESAPEELPVTTRKSKVHLI